MNETFCYKRLTEQMFLSDIFMEEPCHVGTQNQDHRTFMHSDIKS